MAGIFLNYRREDSFGYAGRVYDKLSQYFDKSQIFMDVDTLNPGAPYVDDIHNAINSCVAMITLIGPKWSPSRIKTTLGVLMIRKTWFTKK